MGQAHGARKVIARDSILSAIRAANVPPAPIAAAVPRDPATHDLLEQFMRLVVDVGGHAIVCASGQSAQDVITGLFVEQHEVVVAPGQFAVAENGAVYVDATDLTARVDIVRAEHLVLTISRATIVPTMHDAVKLMPRDSVCGWFISGPSKTADIEQSLVIGAQGARSLHVVIGG